jgi:hypothetical protein
VLRPRRTERTERTEEPSRRERADYVEPSRRERPEPAEHAGYGEPSHRGPDATPHRPVRRDPAPAAGLTDGIRPDTAARVDAMHEESLRAAEEEDRGPRSPELPSWDDILFGTRRNR